MATSIMGETYFGHDSAPGRNRTGSSIGKNLFVISDAATNGPDAVTPSTGDTTRPTGVTAEVIANGANGTIVKRGRKHLVAGGAIAVDARIGPAANGKAQAAVSGDRSCGRALEAAGADGDTFLAEIDCTDPDLIA